MRKKAYLYITLVHIMFIIYIILQIFYNANIERSLARGHEKDYFYDNITKFFWTGQERYLIGLTHEEKEHMKEVKTFADKLCFILSILIIINLYFALKIKNIYEKDVLKVIILLIILSVLLILNFDFLFIEMHKAFFKTKWIFPENYTLIKHYSKEFFTRATILTEIIATIATYMYFKLLKN